MKNSNDRPKINEYIGLRFTRFYSFRSSNMGSLNFLRKEERFIRARSQVNQEIACLLSKKIPFATSKVNKQNADDFTFFNQKCIKTDYR